MPYTHPFHSFLPHLFLWIWVHACIIQMQNAILSCFLKKKKKHLLTAPNFILLMETLESQGAITSDSASSLPPPQHSLTSSLPFFLLASTFRGTISSSNFSHRLFFRQAPFTLGLEKGVFLLSFPNRLFQEFLQNVPSIPSEENSNGYNIYLVAFMFRFGISLMSFWGH